MNCKCLTEIDEKLKEKNLTLSGVAWVMPAFTSVVTIQTEWINPSLAPKGQKRNPPKMHASHCPFCGVKIQIPKDEDDTVASVPNEQAERLP